MTKLIYKIWPTSI